MSKPKKLAAMDLLVKSAALKPAISQSSAASRSPLANLQDGRPVEIPPQSCRPWKLADRPPEEAPHKAELVESFRQDGLGQIQPIVVRAVEDPDAPQIAYEVICGRVRWMAALELGVPVQAIVRELDDREAYRLMSVENRQRKNISDYAKAKSYQKALALGVFASAGEFAEAEGISKSAFSQYLGFAELPEAVAARFADLTKIPYRLGYEISKACKALGEEAVAALVPKIESGEVSRSDIQALQAPPANMPSPARLPEAPAQAGPRLKKSVAAASGRRLFSYNPASRGWLIRLAPEVSARMDEALMAEFGQWLEARLAADQP